MCYRRRHAKARNLFLLSSLCIVVPDWEKSIATLITVVRHKLDWLSRYLWTYTGQSEFNFACAVLQISLATISSCNASILEITSLAVIYLLDLPFPWILTSFRCYIRHIFHFIYTYCWKYNFNQPHRKKRYRFFTIIALNWSINNDVESACGVTVTVTDTNWPGLNSDVCTSRIYLPS